MQEKQLYFSGLKDKPEGRNGGPGLRLDYLIIWLVIILLLLAAAFSLGVEKGKRLAIEETLTAPAMPEAIDPLYADAEDAVLETTPELTVELPPEPVQAEPLESEPAVAVVAAAKPRTEKNPVDVRYRVQVASFKEREAAKKETLSLQNEGFPAYHYKSGEYNVVYVESGNDKEKAEKLRTQLKKKYKDCILRRL
jgi:cell division protein FtsN